MRLAARAAIGAAVIAWGTAVTASSAHTRMTVSVTVVRSCSVNARPVTESSSAIHLTCPSHDSNVLLGTASGDAYLADPSGVHYIGTTHLGYSNTNLLVVTLNF